MKAEEKAKELFNKFLKTDEKCTYSFVGDKVAKQCALIAIENEYRSLRELLFDLRACRVIESEEVYLSRIQQLIHKEQGVKQEIEKL